MSAGKPHLQSELEPIRVIDLDSIDRAAEMLVSRDGGTAYVIVEYVQIDMWKGFLQLWPYMGGVLLLLVLLWLSVRVLQQWRRHRATRGEPFCKTCGYQLTGVESHQCPECGKLITRSDNTRRPMLRPLRHMLLAIVVYLLLVAILGSPVVLKAVEWRSDAFFDYLQSKNASWLVYHEWDVIVGISLHEVNLSTGRTIAMLGRFDDFQLSDIRLDDDDRGINLEDASAIRTNRERPEQFERGTHIIHISLPTENGGIATEHRDTFIPNAGQKEQQAHNLQSPARATDDRLVYHVTHNPVCRITVDDPVTGQEVASLATPGADDVFSLRLSEDGLRLFALVVDPYDHRKVLVYDVTSLGELPSIAP